MTRKTSINHAEAEVIGLKALAFLAQDEKRLQRFMTLTGTTPEELREGAHQTRFLEGVLEYFSTDQSLLLAFTESEGLASELVDAACLRLTGRQR